MVRDKANTKNWRKRDAAYRKDVRDRRQAKALRQAHFRLIEVMAGWKHG